MKESNCKNRNITEQLTDWVILIQTANSAMEADYWIVLTESVQKNHLFVNRTSWICALFVTENAVAREWYLKPRMDGHKVFPKQISIYYRSFLFC